MVPPLPQNTVINLLPLNNELWTSSSVASLELLNIQQTCCCCWVTSVVSDSVRPHRRQPTRLPIPGILQARTLEWVAISFSNAWKWKVKVKSLSCPTLSNPMDYSLPGSSIHGIFQARVLEWGAIAFSESMFYGDLNGMDIQKRRGCMYKYSWFTFLCSRN